MAKSDELFTDAYRLSIVHEQHRQAIDVCKQALSLDPENIRIQVFLGMLLSDYGTSEEKRESRGYFLKAISLAKDIDEICDNWFEESALHHLAIWEWNHDEFIAASLLFLANYLICKSKESFNFLSQLIAELTPDAASDLKTVLSKISQLTARAAQS
ncbi:MAG TPA: hypothetical protein VE969_02925 [Pyrinomonadaceae bacterium]|jgi:tetratricopeptide (TPR) repeat protein|nr:hypothetical protein [Pyrinomonadaceae bacterium]